MREKVLDKLKGVAVLSVVSAHVSITNTSDSNFILFQIIAFKYFGIIGVPIFYLISGYLFENETVLNVSNLIKKKKKILKSWIYLGSVVYLYIALRKNGISLVDWIKFIFGVKTYLYFMTNLFYFYIITVVLKKYKYTTSINISLCIISILANNNNYLNPYNFMGYFIIGQYLNKYDLLHKLVKKININKKIIYLFLFITLYISYYNKWSINYFGIQSNINILATILLLFQIDSLKMKWLSFIGYNSYAIYLIHMPIIGIINNIFNRNIYLIYFSLFRIILTLILNIYIIEFLLKYNITKYIGLKLFSFKKGQNNE